MFCGNPRKLWMLCSRWCESSFSWVKLDFDVWRCTVGSPRTSVCVCLAVSICNRWISLYCVWKCMLTCSWKSRLKLVIDTERFSCSSVYAASRDHVSFIPGVGEKRMTNLMYPSILIQCVNAIACAWVTANSLEETPQTFQRAQQGLCCTVDGEAQCSERDIYKRTKMAS